MPMDIAPSYPPSQARNFALRGLAWSLALFGLIRLAWFETHAVLPFTRFQAALAERGFGVPPLPVDVTVACSGADVIALCTAAILAYPATRPVRLAGAAGGVLLILALNTIRIGTLGRAAGSAWFEPLHLYLWPTLLMVAIAAYVFSWMRVADTYRPAAPFSDPEGAIIAAPRLLTRRFAWTTAVLVVLFTAASPLYLDSAGVLTVAVFVARGAAAALRLLGIEATASGNLLSTSRGAFLVTQECIATPLIPVYLAAVLASVRTWRLRAPALLAALPLFVALGVARLLVVALPPALVGSPLFLIHSFYQFLLAAVLVGVASAWRHGARETALRRALLGASAGAFLGYASAPLYAWLLRSAVSPVGPLTDPQGALALLPAFQAGLFVALTVALFTWARWRSVGIGLAALGLSQAVFSAGLVFGARHGGFIPGVPGIRAWAVAVPALLVLAIAAHERPRR